MQNGGGDANKKKISGRIARKCKRKRKSRKENIVYSNSVKKTKIPYNHTVMYVLCQKKKCSVIISQPNLVYRPNLVILMGGLFNILKQGVIVYHNKEYVKRKLCFFFFDKKEKTMLSIKWRPE